MTEVVTAFGPGEFRFWLAMPQITAFERDHGPLLTFWGSLSDAIGIDKEGDFHFVGSSGPPVAAIRDLIRLALIGGNHGMIDEGEIEVGPTRAKGLVDDYCFPARPLAEGAALAFRVVDAAVRGVRLSAQKKTVVTAAPRPSDAEPSSQTADS